MQIMHLLIKHGSWLIMRIMNMAIFFPVDPAISIVIYIVGSCKSNQDQDTVNALLNTVLTINKVIEKKQLNNIN